MSGHRPSFDFVLALRRLILPTWLVLRLTALVDLVAVSTQDRHADTGLCRRVDKGRREAGCIFLLPHSSIEGGQVAAVCTPRILACADSNACCGRLPSELSVH